LLTKYEVEIRGKSTHKEEFVSAGGINLDSLDTDSFAIKNHKNLYAVGELLNIDALTGGFNFQAAWSGSYIISEHLSSNS
jgi:predicted flavoprotein YhiN